MEHCGKHDIVFPTGGACWNCEESKMSPEEKEAAYQDPQFLQMRGGKGSQSVVLDGLTHSEAQQLRELLKRQAATAPAGSSSSSSSAAAPSSERKVFARA